MVAARNLHSLCSLQAVNFLLSVVSHYHTITASLDELQSRIQTRLHPVRKGIRATSHQNHEGALTLCSSAKLTKDISYRIRLRRLASKLCNLWFHKVVRCYEMPYMIQHGDWKHILEAHYKISDWLAFYFNRSSHMLLPKGQVHKSYSNSHVPSAWEKTFSNATVLRWFYPWVSADPITSKRIVNTNSSFMVMNSSV